MVVGEQAPKNWAILHGDRVLTFLAPPLIAFTYICYPLIWLLNTLSNGLLRITGVGFFDKVHGQMGVSLLNGIELHPVLKIEWPPFK